MIFENLLAVASRAPSSGLRYKGRHQSYAELAERIARLAEGFRSRGIAPGQAVGIVLPNSPDLFVVVHALFAMGAVAMPLSTLAAAEEIATAMRTSRGCALVVGPEHLGLAEDVRLRPGLSRLPVLVSEGDGDDSLSSLARSAPGQTAAQSGDTPALYMLSSGTTGLPKIVPHTHAELLAEARRTSSAWRLQPDDIVFNMLPGNFAMGLLLGAMNTAEAGATTVYWNDPRPLILARRSLIETIRNERATVTGAVPAMYEVMAGAPEDDGLPDLRLAISGGAAVKEATFLGFKRRFGLPLRQTYGCTESLMFSHNDADDIDATWASVGRPAGDGEARIEPTDTGLGSDVGELLVRSSSVMRGYVDNPAADAATFTDGWLRTGDLARVDAEGMLYIVGRSKLLIEVAGYKIDPFEVEETIASHPAIAEAVVVGVRSTPQADQRLKAYVVRRGEVSAEQLIPYLRARLSVQKVPTLIEFREDLPKSSAGKVLRGRLNEEA